MASNNKKIIRTGEDDPVADWLKHRDGLRSRPGWFSLDARNQDEFFKPAISTWQCSCKPRPIKIRVAASDLQAKCLKCGTIFVRVD